MLSVVFAGVVCGDGFHIEIGRGMRFSVSGSSEKTLFVVFWVYVWHEYLVQTSRQTNFNRKFKNGFVWSFMVCDFILGYNLAFNLTFIHRPTGIHVYTRRVIRPCFTTLANITLQSTNNITVKAYAFVLLYSGCSVLPLQSRRVLYELNWKKDDW